MNDKIKQYKQRFFYKLFATLPSVKKIDNFSKELDSDFQIDTIYYFRSKDFWFTKYEKDKYVFLFGIKNQPLKNISEKDVCLIIDFDKDVQFNEDSLGLFSIKNSNLHVLINNEVLNERYPYINTHDFKISNIISFNNSKTFDVIDLGNLEGDLIDNLEKLIKASYLRKSQIESNSHIKEYDNVCRICSKKKNDIDGFSLPHLRNLKPGICDECLEKILVSEFYTKIIPLINGNRTDELLLIKDRIGNEKFEIGLKLLEKYKLIQYFGSKKTFYTIDKNSYLVNKYLKYSDKNNLLIDNIVKNDKIKHDVPFRNEYTEQKIENNESNQLSTEEQMEIVLNAIKMGKSKSDAAKLANIPLYKISHWYNEGRSGNKPENKNFFKQLNNIKFNQKKELLNKINQTLIELKKGKDISQLDFVNQMEIDEWIIKGKENIPPYKKFYKEFQAITKNEIKEYSDNVTNRRIFLKNFSAGKTKEESAINANIDIVLINKWYLKGSNHKEPFFEFYNDYIEIEKGRDLKIPKVVKNDSFGNKNTIMQMNSILEDLSKGKSEDEAILNACVSKNTYKYWINRGKQDFGDLYVQFYKYVYEYRSKQEISHHIPGNVGFDVNLDSGVYAPLPVEYDGSFSSMNKSGIAWVNKVGNQWIYSKQVNGRPIRFSDENIYNLYAEVKKSNNVWGIRDYSRASKFIEIPDDFEVPSIEEFEDEGDDDVVLISDSGVYAPLPVEYDGSFSSMNKSGIAWVNKVGNQWIYSKQVNGRPIRFSDENIYNLYAEVKKSNNVWGIRDYSRASKFIEIPDDFEIPIKQEVGNECFVLENEVDESIYCLLSKDQLSKFNPNPNNRTGIAWVNKIGNNWIYQRQRHGKKVKFVDSNIFNLHKKVIKNNQIWGIIDIDKARDAIENNQVNNVSMVKHESKPVIKNDNISVNYIEKVSNNVEIIITGVIKNKELMDVFYNLDFFKENIKRIVTTSINKKSDIFIELELNKYLLHTFEEKIEVFGWKINK